MRQFIIAIALTGGFCVAMPSTAAVNINQADQMRRIDAGHRSGKLNNAETKHLKAEQRAISRLEAQMRARHGGRLTVHDRRIIHARQARADTEILKLKANDKRGKDHLPF